MLFSNIYTKAQIKVYANGKVQMGSPPVPALVGLSQWSANVQVLGPGSVLNFGGRLCIGDMGVNENNVYIGEYNVPAGDNDQMHVHGKLGQFFTIGSAGTDVRLRIDAVNGHVYATSFVYANGLKLISDEKYKTNIKKYSTTFSELKKLQAVSYNYIIEKTTSIDWSKVDWKNLTEKERKNLEIEKAKTTSSISEKKIGYIAQELQKDYPQLVSVDENGIMAVDYIGLIPIIVEAMKEQDDKIEDQKQKNVDLQSQLQQCCTHNKLVGLEESEIERKKRVENTPNTFASLEQNNPNPFYRKH